MGGRGRGRRKRRNESHREPGASDVAKPENKSAQVFRRLLNHLEGHEVIPFIGAGVSDSAELLLNQGAARAGPAIGRAMRLKLALAVLNIGTEDDEAWDAVQAQEPRLVGKPKKVPADATLEDLEKRLEGLGRQGASSGERRRSGDSDELAQQLQYLIELGGSPLARLSEIVYSKRGSEYLCHTLEIEQLDCLAPTPAHYAIAALVLEGAIHEVITTNYDT